MQLASDRNVINRRAFLKTTAAAALLAPLTTLPRQLATRPTSAGAITAGTPVYWNQLGSIVIVSLTIESSKFSRALGEARDAIQHFGEAVRVLNDNLGDEAIICDARPNIRPPQRLRSVCRIERRS